MSRDVSRGSAGEYQADEQAGVARLRYDLEAAAAEFSMFPRVFKYMCEVLIQSLHLFAH